jgi:hypothetical protein
MSYAPRQQNDHHHVGGYDGERNCRPAQIRCVLVEGGNARHPLWTFSC